MMVHNGCHQFVLLALWMSSRFTNSYDTYTDRKFIRNYSNLTEVPDDIPDEALEVDLVGNKISKIQANAFLSLSQCTVIKLNYNTIRSIQSGAFNGLTSLKSLSLGENLLTQLKGGTFEGLESLERLHLEKNQIETVEVKVFHGLSRLTELYILDNKLIQLISNMFSGLDSLVKLVLSRNKVNSIDDGTFIGLSNLKELWLDGNNHISDLRRVIFEGLPDLTYLAIHTNNISTVPQDVFMDLINLEVLDLDDNFITEIPVRTFGNLGKLKELWLYNNSLSTLEEGVFREFPRRLNLTIGANPLQCDSKLCWIKQGERDGWLKWLKFEKRPLEPQCASGVLWNVLKLDCSPEERTTDHTSTTTKDSSAPSAGGNEDTLKLALIIVGVVIVTVVVTLIVMVCLKRRGIQVCYKEQKPGSSTRGATGKKVEEDVPGVRYTDSVKMDNPQLDGGFINTAGPPADDDDYTKLRRDQEGYINLQRPFSSYLQPVDGYEGPSEYPRQYITPIPPPPYTAQDSYVEIDESKMM